MSTTSAQGLTALSSTLLGLSTIAVSLRFYARRTQKTSFGSDDWIMIPCLILFLGTTSCTFYGLDKRVLGYPTPKDSPIPVKTAEMTSKLYVVFDFFSIATLGCVKISAVLFFRRIFCVLSKRTVFSRVTMITLVTISLWTVVYLILIGLTCGVHFSALWTSHIDYVRYCHIGYPVLFGLAISDFLLDIWIICLPLPTIWKLQTTPKRKLSITGVFLLALVGLGASLARLIVFVQLEHAQKNSLDPRLANTKSIYLCVLEAGLSLIAVNLPSLWCLSSKIKPENILRSVRSMISLRSGRLVASQSSLGKTPGLPSSSQSYLARLENQSTETYAMHEIEDGKPSQELPRAKIQITNRIYQTETHL